jgi:Family of unknown function (DUF6088)
MSVAQKVLFRLNRIQRGAPFSIDGFYELGNQASVQKAFSRLVEEGVVERVSKGFYVRPKPLPSIPSIKTTASAEDVARAWARKHGYKLVSQGMESAYRLGFQSQAPIKTVYWSNGPSRNFSVGNETVEIKHRSANQLRWENKPEGIMLRGITVTPAENVEEQMLINAFERLALNASETKSVIHKLHELALPRPWQIKLESFERTLNQ